MKEPPLSLVNQMHDQSVNGVDEHAAVIYQFCSCLILFLPRKAALMSIEQLPRSIDVEEAFGEHSTCQQMGNDQGWEDDDHAAKAIVYLPSIDRDGATLDPLENTLNSICISMWKNTPYRPWPRPSAMKSI
jgi:hypothetical protein